VNPKLLGVDLILMGNRRPRLMFVCFLLGGMGLALTIGLLDVFVVHADAIQSQGSASAALDLCLGVPLLVIGVLLVTGHLPGRRQRPAEASHGPPRKDGWVQRVLLEPRYGLAVLIGAAAGTPGAAYLAALHQLVNGGASTAVQALSVAGFVVVEFALVIIPFLFLTVRPEATEMATRRFKEWIVGHARQLLTAIALLVGGYMVLSGALRLLG
jgi:Sap, sulfolipid-1-addressing protein